MKKVYLALILIPLALGGGYLAYKYITNKKRKKIQTSETEGGTL